MKLPEIDIEKKLLEISKKGFIKTLREGNTGIGFTLETLLGIKENNEGDPDFTYQVEPVELKAQREKASSRITLITKSPHWDPLSDKKIIEKYGYKDKKGRKGLKITLKATDFNQWGLKLEIDEDANRLNIIHKSDGTVCYFFLDELMKKLSEKLFKNLLLVIAETKGNDKNECFHYKNAVLLTNLTEDSFMKLLKEGLIVWEFRMHIKESGSVRDHGSGFRINRKYIDKLYEKKQVILGEREINSFSK
jgi:hypothetical protein